MSMFGKTLVISADAYHMQDVVKGMNLTPESKITVFGNPSILDTDYDTIVFMPACRHLSSESLRTDRLIDMIKRYVSLLNPTGKVVDLCGFTKLLK